MKELNLEVGQKVWSIQLGDCEVIGYNNDKLYPYKCRSIKDGVTCSYTVYGKDDESDSNPSLFESNPFEQKLVQENKDGWIEWKENKAELINALFNVHMESEFIELSNLAKDKLQKLLESL